MTNLDLGVKRALVATLVATGVSPSSAAERVTAPKVAAGVAYLKIRFTEAQRNVADDETRWNQAFQDLKRWALSEI